MGSYSRQQRLCVNDVRVRIEIYWELGFQPARAALSLQRVVPLGRAPTSTPRDEDDDDRRGDDDEDAMII